ncbi:hypothetical protein TNCV_114681 [Trichonephila clavipes]|nr:hypothetical protein TNCV_114681 [Trichonephila clavipes]
MKIGANTPTTQRAKRYLCRFTFLFRQQRKRRRPMVSFVWGMAEHILSVPSFFSVRSSHSCLSKRTGPAAKDEVTIQEGMSGKDTRCPRE